MTSGLVTAAVDRYYDCKYDRECAQDDAQEALRREAVESLLEDHTGAEDWLDGASCDVAELFSLDDDQAPDAFMRLRAQFLAWLDDAKVTERRMAEIIDNARFDAAGV